MGKPYQSYRGEKGKVMVSLIMYNHARVIAYHLLVGFGLAFSRVHIYIYISVQAQHSNDNIMTRI